MKQTTLRAAIAMIIAVLTSVRTNAQQNHQDMLSYEVNDVDRTYTSLVFSSAAGWHPQQAHELISRYFASGAGTTAVPVSSTTTRQSIRTDRYSQYYKGLRVELSSFSLVSKNDIVSYVTANYYNIPGDMPSTPSLSEQAALDKALAHEGATRYTWQDTARERMLKTMTGNPDTSFFPKGTLVWIEDKLGANDRKLHLAYAFNIYAIEPLSRDMVYVDAQTGKILFVNALLENTVANGTSLYSGNISFQARPSGSTYVLQDNTRGAGIHTYNCGGGDGSTSTDFTSGTTTFATDAALDAHWGAEKVYDYWYTVHGRNSFNNAGAAINSFVHYLVGYNNAFWDGYEMVYGDGTGISSGGFSPLVAMDVCAHEIGHAVCQYTSALAYNREAGAMNEGFSDIWGAVIENYANPFEVDAVPKNKWAIGEEISSGSLRRMDNPNLRGQPDTYGGAYWYSISSCTPSSGNDYCGVHTNSGVLNYWFYLLTQGGAGTNDIGSVFAVTGVGMTKAANIAYQTELSLTSTATYASCRAASISAATLLYGPCSPEVEAVTRAWYAVGVGANYVSTTPAITGASNVCAGATTLFTIATSGGAWSSSNTAIATVNTSGTVTGIAAGVATISYATSGCYSTRAITVNAAPSAGTISGASTISAGGTTPLTPSVTGGTWTSSNPGTATVSTSGVVTGIIAGTANITYTVSNTCGSAYVVKGITVSAANAAPVFTGGSSQVLSICRSSSARSISSLMTVTDANVGQTETWTVLVAPAHGTLTGFSTTALSTGGSISPSGVSYTPATGYTGTDAFTIRISDGVAVSTTVVNVTVTAPPYAGTISGPVVLFAGTSYLLSGVTPGGTWTSSNTTLAIVNPATGVMTGISAGPVVISYSLSNSCGTSVATKNITIKSAKSISDTDTTATTGTAEIKKEAGIAVYPNPTTGQFYLNTPVAGRLLLFSIQGQLIGDYAVNEGSNTLDMRHGLAPGIYIAKFTGSDGSDASVRIVYQP